MWIVQSLQIVTFMLKEPAAGYSKITTDLTTEPELDSKNNYLPLYCLTVQLTDQLSNLLQQKIHSYIGGPKGSLYYNTVGLSQQ